MRVCGQRRDFEPLTEDRADSQRRTCASLKAVPKVLSDLKRVLLNVIRQADRLRPVPKMPCSSGR